MNRRTALIFYVLSIYVVVQFIWWGYHLIELTAEIGQSSELVSKRIAMVIGEGAVFLLLLLIGIWQIRKSIQRELKLSERQNNFLLSVTHELKTPLAANKLYIQTVSKRTLEKEQSEALLKKAIEENVRLEHMIDNILNASRLENNALSLVKQEFSLNQLVDNIQNRFNTIHDESSVSVKYKEEVKLNADKFMIETVLNNLVENAIKYGGDDANITLYISKDNDNIVFGVKDNGPGISKQHKKLVFQKFFRIGNEEIRNQKGSGLGLFIVDQLIKIHGGSIECLDNEPSGTNFQISLPND